MDVIPHLMRNPVFLFWIPAFAGMTTASLGCFDNLRSCRRVLHFVYIHYCPSVQCRFFILRQDDYTIRVFHLDGLCLITVQHKMSRASAESIDTEFKPVLTQRFGL